MVQFLALLHNKKHASCSDSNFLISVTIPLFLFLAPAALSQKLIKINLKSGEKIWSGAISEGSSMPFGKHYSFNFYANNIDNQLQPLLLSNKGLYVWSEEPFQFEIANDILTINNYYGKVSWGRSGNSLSEARNFSSSHFFPPSGKLPDELLFSKPQYNTWIELTYNQNEKDVLKYADAIIANGFKPGVLMIDDTWQEDYGLWQFHPARFPHPKEMIEQLHKLGFKVMLWICPFVSPDQPRIVKQIMKNKGFLLQKTHDADTWDSATEPALIKWWNGYSNVLDFSNVAAKHWFENELKTLVEQYDIDGFKFDAGDMQFYPANTLSKTGASPNKQCELYAQFGLLYPLNEYRACWKYGGQALAQRLHDKNHSWEDLQKLIPQMLAEGLVGYTFSCPDMIGGGNYQSFLNLNLIDQDLVVRSAQIHALMPMMQFSVAPWRILDEKHLKAVKNAVAIREKFTPILIALARQSAKTGSPIINNLEYCYPGKGYDEVNDEFMLGNNILIAPILTKDSSRKVILPPGNWTDLSGSKYQGNQVINYSTKLDDIPVFQLQ